MFISPKTTFPHYAWLGAVMTALMATLVPDAHGATLSLMPSPGKNYVQTATFSAGHLQGIATNGTDAIYWSFTTRMVKTDAAGNTLASVPVIDHHGDATFVDGRVYVAVNDRVSENPGQFNVANPNNPARQWIYEYDEDLNLVSQHSVPEVIYGAGGIAHRDGKFLVVGGLHTSETQNFVYEYDNAFQYVKTHILDTGYTDRGIQTAEFAQGHWWFGTYQSEGGVLQLLKLDQSLPPDEFSQFSFNASYGLAALSDGHILLGTTHSNAQGVFGRVHLAIADDVLGLKVVSIPVPEPASFTQVSFGALILVFLGCFLYRVSKRDRSNIDGDC